MTLFISSMAVQMERYRVQQKNVSKTIQLSRCPVVNAIPLYHKTHKGGHTNERKNFISPK